MFFISCGSSGRTAEKTSLSFKSDQVRVKQEPGTEDEVCSFSGAVKQEKSEDGRRSACMVSSCWVSRALEGPPHGVFHLCLLDSAYYVVLNIYACNRSFASQCLL